MKDIRRVLRLRGVGRDVDEELAFHFDRTVTDLMAAGRTREAAEAEARLRFGDVSHYRKELEMIDERAAMRRRWSDRWDVARQSVRYAIRSLARSPGLAAGVVLAFALGIGANLTMYGIVDRLLLSPPDHIADAAGLRRIYASGYVPYLQERFTGSTISYPDYRQLRTVSAFSDVAAWARRTVTAGEGLGAVEKSAVYATGNFFPLLGVEPALGRFYTEQEDRVGGPRQVVLGWSEWQREHAGAADVIGRTIDFGYGAYEVIGVAPRNFTGVDLEDVSLWLPFHTAGGDVRGTAWLDDLGTQFFETVARLRPESTDEQAAAEATAAWLAVREGTPYANPDAAERVELASVLSARGPDAPAETVVARLLLIVSMIVLLIAAVNVANLLLARSLKQRREIAVRLALGISRRRLIGQIMLEGLILAFAGGVAAALLALASRGLVGGILLPDVVWSDAANGRIIAAAAVLALVAGAAASLIPALQAARGTLSDTLRQAGAGGVTVRAARFRAGLSLAQTAMSVLLLIGAGLFVRSLDRVRDADLGFDPDNLIYAMPQLTTEGIPRDEMHTVMERGRESLLRVPGVLAAGATHSLPFHSFRTTRLRAEGVDSIPIPSSGGPYLYEVTPGFLEAMDLAILSGRTITERDAGAAQPVALINRSMAEGLWPGESPLGRCLYIGSGPESGPQTRCSEVVGVVEDSRRQEIENVTTFQYYIPLAQHQGNGMPRVLVIRVAEQSAATNRALRAAILGFDPRIRYVDAEPLMNRIDPSTRSWQLGAAVFSIFGVLALIVSSIGLYSVLSFDVAQRTREIGVRSALGASSRAVVSLVVGNALRITALGVVIGVAGALVLSSRIEPLLFGVGPRDPVTFLVVVIALHVTAALASSLPAWRASRVDPNVALRTD
jgi:putative ABC transport system permease protein